MCNETVLSQNNKTEKIVKSGTILRSDKSSYYYENDKKGNSVFVKNNRMNGPITMIFFNEYDSLDRIVKSLFVHSNIGFYLSENIYIGSKIYHYNYMADSIKESEYNRDLLNKIKTRKEFLSLKVFTELYKSKKTLTSIDSVDKFNNVVSELSFDENGDTSGYNTYQFNSYNKEIVFHLGTKGSEGWTWDIYSEYDSNQNLIKNYRISWENGQRDTTEVRNYKYDNNNNLIEEVYSNSKIFKNKTTYLVNANNKLVEETFYEGEPDKVDVVTNYQYNNYNLPKRKESIDYRNGKKGTKEVSIYTYIYW